MTVTVIKQSYTVKQILFGTVTEEVKNGLNN